MERYRDMTTRKKANTKMARNLVFFILLIAFTFWIIFKDQDLNQLVDSIKSADIKYIVIAALLMFCVYLMETINVRSVLISLGEKNFSIVKAFKYTAIGTFFSAITPAATGGQPVEIYYMSKDNIKAVNGTLAMLIQLCGFQLSTLILSIICAVCNPSLLGDGLLWLYILGIVINAVALILMFLATFSNKLIQSLANLFLKILKKIKIKNYEARKEAIMDGVREYADSAKYIRTHKADFVKAMIRVFIQICIYHSIPYFIYRAFGLNELNFFQLFSMQAVLFTTVSGIPLPGSVGISESVFLKLYGKAFGASLLGGAMLLYRFVSFYFYIIIFAVVVVINAVRSKNVKSEIDIKVKEIEEDFKKTTKKKKAYA